LLIGGNVKSYKESWKKFDMPSPNASSKQFVICSELLRA